jgi:hypothetical protein
MTRSLLLGLVLTSSPLLAQQPGLAGAWKVTYPGGSKVEDGYVTQIMVTGVLTIAAHQDSLVGTLVMDPQPDLAARPPARLAAVNGPAGGVFMSQTVGTLNINGAERPITVVSTWKLRANGNVLEGTVERKVEGLSHEDQGPLPVKGTRQVP